MRRRTIMMLAVAAILGGIGSAAFWSARNTGPDTPPAARPSSLVLRVDLSERQLHVEIGGVEDRAYGVAVGTGEHPTPRGAFTIRRVIWNPRWVPPDAEWARDKQPAEPGDPSNPMGRVKMFFRDPDYFLHGTGDEVSIGRAASHGCLRMRNEDIIELARLVMEHGGEPREPGWFQRILNRITSTREVRLPSPVLLEIRT